MVRVAMGRVRWAGLGVGLAMLALVAAAAMHTGGSAAVRPVVTGGSPGALGAPAPQVPTLPALPVGGAEPRLEDAAGGLEEAMRGDLAGRMGVPVARVMMVSIDTVTWADGCLGVHEAGMVCAQALTRGFLATLAIDGLPWAFHYHGTGGSFIAAPFVAEAALSAPFE